MPKKSIRPITFRRVVETIDVSVKRGVVDEYTLSTTLKTTHRRAREILLELQRMDLLHLNGKTYTPDKKATVFLSAFNEENWHEIHTILFENYPFYRAFMLTITEKFSSVSFSKDDLGNSLKDDEKLNFNRTALDVLCDWSERLGILQRNLYTYRFYVADQNTDDTQFPEILQTIYEGFNLKLRPGMKQEYVEIARIRESLCEKQRIKRDAFDSLLKRLFQESRGKIELCGAPITSVSKKSPSSLKEMKRGTKDTILSPEYLSSDEARGMEINGKEYRFIAIFETLKGVPS